MHKSKLVLIVWFGFKFVFLFGCVLAVMYYYKNTII